jgi:hypothetical protein
MPGDGTQERRKTSDLMRKVGSAAVRNYETVYHTHSSSPVHPPSLIGESTSSMCDKVDERVLEIDSNGLAAAGGSGHRPLI